MQLEGEKGGWNIERFRVFGWRFNVYLRRFHVWQKRSCVS